MQKRTRFISICWALLLAVAAPSVVAAETGLLTRKSDLTVKPSTKAAVVTQLPGGTPVTVLQRRGVWFEVAVRGSSKKGWVRFSRVRMTTHKSDNPTQTAASASGSNALADLARSATGLFSYGGRKSTSEGVSTIGIRGLQAEDLANARPNPAARTEMESHRATHQQATLYAKVAQLRSQEVAYLNGEGKGGLSFGGFSLSLPTSSGSANAISGTKD